MAVVRDQLQGGFQLLAQFSRALAAERTALQQHHPITTAERWRARLLQGLGRLARIAAIEAALEHTLAYVKERQAFGKPIIDFQNTRFKLAELDARVPRRP